MLDLKKIELHDAILRKMDIDYVLKIVRISLDFYENEDVRIRKSASISFEGVESITQICNVERLQQNSTAGNINYWAPDQDAGITYIYLVDGCLEVKAKSVNFSISK